MYKILLCLRYLKTRYIALACIVSVMLGVATMIVVNSVMAGFGDEMRDRIHGMLADVILETNSVDGRPDPERHMEVIRQVAGEYIEGMTPTVEIYGMISFQHAGQWITRPVTLIGVDPEGKAKVGPLKEYLESYREVELDDGTLRPPLREQDEPLGWELTENAREYRRKWTVRSRRLLEGDAERSPFDPPEGATIDDDVIPFDEDGADETGDPPATEPPPFSGEAPDFSGDDPELAAAPDESASDEPPDEPVEDEATGEDAEADDASAVASPDPTDLFPGGSPDAVDAGSDEDVSGPLPGRLYVGAGLVSYPFEHPETGETRMVKMVRPGDDVKVSTVTAGRPPNPVHFNATVVDVFKSGMSEYDTNLVFCNLEYLQEARGMFDPGTGTRSITSVQIKLEDYAYAPEVVKRLRAAFPAGMYSVRTWEQKQGPLLAAVEVESAILNVLLFLIIAVAGFGILAIFYMIVVEKTRDIGILKALGASSGGVMSIFLSYGLALGFVGSGVGVVLGLVFVWQINTIEDFLTWITGRKVFNETIYYFPEIPTSVSPWMVCWVALGAMAIAVLASILPARRAARLHPVQALRFDQ